MYDDPHYMHHYLLDSPTGYEISKVDLNFPWKVWYKKVKKIWLSGKVGLKEIYSAKVSNLDILSYLKIERTHTLQRSQGAQGSLFGFSRLEGIEEGPT